MIEILPFFILGAVLSVLTCLASGWAGWWLAAMLIVLFIAFSLAAVAAYLIVNAVIAAFVDRSRPQRGYSPYYWAVMRCVIVIILFFTRTRIHLSGEDKLPPGRWLLVSNHRSNIDPIATVYALRKYRLAFISKPQNFKIPLVGGVIHKCCFLPIDRENAREAMKTILTAAETLKSGVVSYGIYPEGTRSRQEEMLPFKNGAFKIAQKAKTPIVIASIKNSDNVAKNAPFRHTDVYLNILSVMDAETVSALKTTEIGDEVRRLIENA